MKNTKQRLMKNSEKELDSINESDFSDLPQLSSNLIAIQGQKGIKIKFAHSHTYYFGKNTQFSAYFMKKISIGPKRLT